MLQQVNHPNIIYLESFTDLNVKRKFINTCDAMIHACSLGESWGLSILEFCLCNKPVITWNNGVWHKQHLNNLGDKAIKYNNKEELYKILNEFNPKNHKHIDYTSVASEFTPTKIMSQFKEVFLDSLLIKRSDKAIFKTI